MKRYKLISFLIAVVMMMSLSTTIQADTAASSAEGITVFNAASDQGTKISIGSAAVKTGGQVQVPISISGNTGICGAVLEISYDNALVLSDISVGAALSSLVMTKPGDMSNNPIKIVWDGLEADNTNGVIATLTFNVPKEVGVYNISVSYEDGDIIDGNLSPVNVHTESGSITVSEEEQPPNLPSISIGNVTAKAGTQAEVPVIISDNNGICGASLSISYDNALVLTDISAGTALSSLNMTKPGKLSLNPFKLVWDGLEADNTNGVIAVLTFTAPSNIGSYNISASYDEGDIVDENLNPIAVKTEQGQIKVSASKSIIVEIDDKKVELTGYDDMAAEVLAAFYNNDGTLISLERQSADNSIIKFSNTDNASYAKVMLWESLNTLKPVCGVQTVNLK